MKKLLIIGGFMLFFIKITFSQSFSYYFTTDSVSIGQPQDELKIYGNIVNHTGSDFIIKIFPTVVDLADNWTYTICFSGACYFAPDTAYFFALADSTESLYFSYITSDVEDSSAMKITFLNSANTADYYENLFHGVTKIDASVKKHSAPQEYLNIYPNPFRENAVIHISYQAKNATGLSLSLYDILGNEVQRYENISSKLLHISSDGLSRGVYFYQLKDHGELIDICKIVIE